MAGSRSSQRSTVSSRSTTPHAASSGTNSGANFGGSSAPASPSFLSRAFPALAASVLALTAVVFAFTYSRPSLGRCDLLQLQLLGRKQGDDLGKHLKVLEKQMNYNKKLVGALQASLAKLTAADSAAAAEADTSAPADVAIPGNASTRQLVELAARQVADEVRASMEETGRGGREGGGGGETVGAGRLNGGESGGGRAADGDWDRMEGGEMEEWEVPQELGSGEESVGEGVGESVGEGVGESVGEDERRAGGRRRLLMSRDEWPRVTYLFRGKMAHQRHPEENATEERDLNNKFLESFKQPGGQQPDFLIMSIGAHEVIGWNRRPPPDLDVATFKKDTEELLQLLRASYNREKGMLLWWKAHYIWPEPRAIPFILRLLVAWVTYYYTIFYENVAKSFVGLIESGVFEVADEQSSSSGDDTGENRHHRASLVDVFLTEFPSVFKAAWVRFPTRDELPEMVREFAAIKGVPAVVGAVDGTHIHMKGMEGHRAEYWTRKSTYAVQLQITCDARGRIWDYLIGYPGSAHDMRVFKESALLERLHNGDIAPYQIVGDAAYPLR
ncbi:unnamed protein product [Closterium sp. Naga37s-1]|nr:unnamed protein product [Closterium sp. Naga37s-1]